MGGGSVVCRVGLVLDKVGFFFGSSLRFPGSLNKKRVLVAAGNVP